ncbi:hypothetical protein BT69DRAFT_495473 [Atractiella rhizophila]|nr:hypothetical protein BT69DRAFT_495473 [Atractiella rhizophila]
MSPEPVLPVEDPSVDYASFAASMVGTSLPDSEVDGLGMGGLTGGMGGLGLGLEGRKSPRSGPGSQDEVTSSMSKLPFGASTRQRTPSSSDSSPPSLNSSVAWNMPGGAASASGRLSRGTSPSFPSPSKVQPQPLVPKISPSYTKGDCIILSEDGMLFRVYRAELWKSAPLLEDVSMGVRIKQGMGNDIASNVLPVEESGTTVETLLGWIIVGGKVEERKPEELGGAIKAAREWGCDRDVIDTMKETIVAMVKTPLDALNLYILADSLQDSHLLSHASRLTVSFSTETPLSILESTHHLLSSSSISPPALNALWSLHALRSDRSRAILSTPLSNIPIGETRPHNGCKNREPLELYWAKTRTVLLGQQGAAFEPRDLVRKPGEGSTGITCVACYRCFLHTVEMMEQEWREVPAQVNLRY